MVVSWENCDSERKFLKVQIVGYMIDCPGFKNKNCEIEYFRVLHNLE